MHLSKQLNQVRPLLQATADPLEGAQRPGTHQQLTIVSEVAASACAMCEPDILPREKRYPAVSDCTWHGRGKCVNFACRYSLLQERPHVGSWEPEDFDELVDALPSTCALDMADLGGMRLDEVATLMGLPRPRVEQCEISALRTLAKSRELRKVRWDGR